jgi:hypothetical protein
MTTLAGVGVGATLGLSGCVEQSPFVEGVVHHASWQIASPGQYLVIRAVPDHPDGFDPRRGYHGHEAFIESVPATAIDFPYAFHIPGPRPRAHGKPWRLLAWLTENPHAEWIQPGELFGTTDFELVHTAYGPAFSEDLEVTLEDIAPPPIR